MINTSIDSTQIDAGVGLILDKMSKAGMPIDQKELQILTNKATNELTGVNAELNALIRQDINLGSPKQLQNVLMGMGIPLINGSTSSDDLKHFADEYKVIRPLLRYRKIENLLNSFLLPYPKFIDPKDQRIHCKFKVNGSETGRIIGYEPNMQALVGHVAGIGDPYACIKPPQGKVFVVADYSAIELVLLFILSKEDALMQAYKDNLDLHKTTAATIFNIEYKAVTEKQRAIAKQVTYATLYGAGASLVSKKTGISYSEGEQFINQFFDKFKKIKRFQDKVIAFARREGYAYSVYGRKRYFEHINSTDYQKRKQAERAVLNMPLQSSCADLMKLALIKIDEALSNEFHNRAQLLMTVHDSVLIETDIEIADQLLSTVTELMTTNILPEKYDGILPLRVDAVIQPSWTKIKNTGGQICL